MKNARRTFLGLVFLSVIGMAFLLSPLGHIASSSGAAAAELVKLAATGGCAAGIAYDPNCDVDRNGLTSILDIMLVSSKWGTSGTWTSEAAAWPETIADLKALDTSAHTRANVLGYYAAGDGGGGVFRFDPASAKDDNGGTVLAPDVGSGRWLRVYSGALNLRWFGAKGDGSTDDSDAILRAFTELNYFPHGELFVPGGTYMTKEFGNLSPQPGWSAISGLNGKRIVGEGSLSIFKLIAGENTPLFSATSATGGIRDIRFDGNNPTPAWGGALNNPSTPHLVYMNGYGYDLENVVAQFSGGDGFRLEGNVGVVDVRGANSKAWWNWGWGYVISHNSTVRMNSPWVEQNLIGGVFVEADDLSNSARNAAANIVINDLYFERVSTYPDGHPGFTTAIKLSAISGVKINNITNYLGYNDVMVHIAAVPTNEHRKYSTGNEIKTTKAYGRYIVEEGCDNNLFIRTPSYKFDDVLQIDDNATGTTVVWESSPYAVNEGVTNAETATVYCAGNSAYIPTSGLTNSEVIPGGLVSPYTEYRSDIGGPAHTRLNDNGSYSRADKSNDTVLPTDTTLYATFAIKTDAIQPIQLQLYDDVHSAFYNFRTKTWGTHSYALIHADKNSTWYSIPIVMDSVTGRKIRTDLISAGNHPVDIYHMFVSTNPNLIGAMEGNQSAVLGGNAVSGITPKHPASAFREGFSFYDLTSSKWLTSNGTSWLDHNGVVVP